MTEEAKLIAAMRDQCGGAPPSYVFVLDIVSIRFETFTPAIRAQMERYTNLQMLTLNDCGIKSLENFPHLPGLIRLDLVFNQIEDQHLQYLRTSRHLQTLMLGGNKIATLAAIRYLSGHRQLLQLDLINNPIQTVPNYREQAYAILPTLSVLDTLDRGGKDAYGNNTMMEAISRIPDNLFEKIDHTAPLPTPMPPHTVHLASTMKSKLKKALARTGSLDSSHGHSVVPAAPKPLRASGKGKASSRVAPPTSSRTKSARAGLCFPVSRIQRTLRSRFIGCRISAGSSVYTAAILEYLTAQMLEAAGNVARTQRKARIVPSMIREALRNDEELSNMLQNVVMRMSNE